MGYTHYWLLHQEKMGEVREALPLILADFRKLLPHLPPLAGPLGEGEPELEGDRVAFNGPSPYDHEPFVFPSRHPGEFPSLDDPAWFLSFCDTRRYPYGLAVQAFLLLARLRLGEAIRLGSDGSLADWAEAAELVERVLGTPVDLPSFLGRTFLVLRDREGKRFLYEANLDEEELGKLLEVVEGSLPHPFAPPVVLEGVGAGLSLGEIRQRYIYGSFYRG